jgi:3-oxoacyl-[acyl-carrier protein] reductase
MVHRMRLDVRDDGYTASMSSRLAVSSELFGQRVALVTAATGPLGRSIAMSLAESGAAVIVNYTGAIGAAQDIVMEIQRQGGEAMGVEGCAGTRAAAREILKTAVARFGGVDIVINVAGAARYPMTPGMAEDVIRHALSADEAETINVLAQAAQMIRGRGRIVHVFVETNGLPPTTQRLCGSARQSGEQFVTSLAMAGRESDISVIAVLADGVGGGDERDAAELRRVAEVCVSLAYDADRRFSSRCIDLTSPDCVNALADSRATAGPDGIDCF